MGPVLLSLLEKDLQQRMDGEEAAHGLERISTVDRPRTPEAFPTAAVGADRARADTAVVAEKDGGKGSRPVGNGRDGDGGWFRRNKTPAIWLGSVLAVLLVAGIGLWAGASLLDDDSTQQQAPAPAMTSPSPPSQTGPVPPYGDRVGLEGPLKPGQCVTAAWVADRFQGLPRLNTVDCGKASPDGQVVEVVRQTSLKEAQTHGQPFCEGTVRDLVSKMADARAYALPPSEAAWERGFHDMACLVFNKSASLMGPVGEFRKYGDTFRTSNTMIGDCFDTREKGDIFEWVLQPCDRSHDQQVVGFLVPPKGISFDELTGQSYDLCPKKYGATYKNEEHDLFAWYDDQLWNSGYRYLMCAVVSVEQGAKLPPGDVLATTG